jgi:hypothetical protein
MGLVFWHCLLLQLLRWTGMDWDQKTALSFFFLGTPIIIQIMIILHKDPSVATGLNMDQPSGFCPNYPMANLFLRMELKVSPDSPLITSPVLINHPQTPPASYTQLLTQY